MPLINCVDCNKEMSDSAPACPNCGRPNANVATQKRSVSILLGIGIFLMPLIFSWFTLRKGHTATARVISFIWLISTLVIYGAQNSKHGEFSNMSSSPVNATQEQVMNVQIDDILAAYENNEVAADNTYKGQLIQVTGIVDDIKKDITNTLFVTLGTGAQFEIPQLQALFDDSMNQQLGQLKKGQRLTVVCRVEGLMMNVLARNCAIK